MTAAIAHYFPGIPLISSDWGTADNWIPWQTFHTLNKQIDVLEHRKIVYSNMAMLNAAGSAMGDEKTNKRYAKIRDEWMKQAKLI